MSLESKKIEVLELILSLKDEKLLDFIKESIQKSEQKSDNALIEKYSSTIEPKLDLSKIIQEQQPQKLSKVERCALIKEIDLQESFEEILKMS